MLSNFQKKHFKVVENGVEYYSLEGFEDVKKEMLRLLSIIDDICSKKDIKYWIDAGSLIGVLRHDGFIPWDDDLDISILKSDYLKLIKELTSYTHSHDDAFIIHESPQGFHACNFFASRNVYSRTQGSVGIIPVKVDIRPLNCIKNTAESIAENNTLRDTANQILFKKKKGYAEKIPISAKKIRDFFYKYNNNYGCESIADESNMYVHPYFEFSSTFELRYSDLFPLKRHRFEDIEVSIPNNYDYILTELYGNYMQLPPIENRAPVACQVYKFKMSKKQHKLYIKHMFGIGKNNILTKILLILDLIRIIGLKEFLNIKINERRAY